MSALLNLINKGQLDLWRSLTDERINSILHTPNMQIPQSASVYYISPNGNDANDGTTPQTAWNSINKLNELKKGDLPEGSYVCFERGGIFRGKFRACRGVTYTAYGEGQKPQIYGSPFDAADPSLWTKADADNIWELRLGKEDVGTLIFNHGEDVAIKCVIRREKDGSTFNNTTGEPFKTYADLTTDLHFFHDYYDTGILYLYSEQNPGERFASIEINTWGNIISVGSDNVTIDNLCIKYTGSHGVGASTVNNLTVQNCEFCWIGGSILSETFGGRNHGTRFGNAVEIYGGCDGYTVVNNYIYQIYDAGITQQVNVNGQIMYQKNMNYSGNVLEYCYWPIEFWLAGYGDDNPSCIENMLIANNYMWYTGKGLCEQRPDKTQGACIKTWLGHNRAKNILIKDNLMLYSHEMVIEYYSSVMNLDGTDCMPQMENNHILARLGQDFGVLSQGNRTRAKYDENIVEYLGDKSKDDVFWYYE